MSISCTDPPSYLWTIASRRLLDLPLVQKHEWLGLIVRLLMDISDINLSQRILV